MTLLELSELLRAAHDVIYEAKTYRWAEQQGDSNDLWKRAALLDDALAEFEVLQKRQTPPG